MNDSPAQINPLSTPRQKALAGMETSRAPNRSTKLAPRLLESSQGQFGSLDGRGRIDRTHGGAERLAVFVGNKFRAVSDVVYDAELHIGQREHGFDGLRQSRESIAAQDENLLDAASLQII